jgi:hypothetical protein
VRRGETQEKLKIEGRLARWLIALGFGLLRLWERTLGYEIDDRAGVVGRPVTENSIGAFWHNRLLIFPFVAAVFSKCHGAALISASRDGELFAEVVQRLARRYADRVPTRSDRDPSAYAGAHLRSRCRLLLTVRLDQFTNSVRFSRAKIAAVVPMNLEYSHCWRLETGTALLCHDHSAVRVHQSAASIKPTTTPDEFESERLALQNAMMALVEMR